jgi:hypothetical protein
MKSLNLAAMQLKNLKPMDGKNKYSRNHPMFMPSQQASYEQTFRSGLSTDKLGLTSSQFP